MTVVRTLSLAGLVAGVLACAGCAGRPEVEGTIADVDLARNMITLNHQAIPNVKMPAMQMTFGAGDHVSIREFKPGDHVRFTADFVNGSLTVTSIARE